MAVDRDFSRSDGSRETDFFEIEAWQKTAEFISKYFKKGQLICLEGRLQRDDWTDKNGVKKSAYKIIASTCYFTGSKPQETRQNDTLTPDFDPFA